jgi:hypothetical protein
VATSAAAFAAAAWAAEAREAETIRTGGHGNAGMSSARAATSARTTTTTQHTTETGTTGMTEVEAETATATAATTAASPPLRLPTHLRLNRVDGPGTERDVDALARALVRVMAEHGVHVLLRRQAPFKYLLSIAGGGAGGGGGGGKTGVASRPQQPQVVVLKAENHRLLVKRGPSAQAVDLVDVIARLAASSSAKVRLV